jgi:gliding motility-associated-like protein
LYKPFQILVLKIKLVIIFVLSLLPLGLIAQCPGFYLDKYVGCTPLNIIATDTSGGGSSKQYQFDSNLPFADINSHSYILEGTYKVIQRGNFPCGTVNGSKSSPPQTVVVKPIPTPVLQASPCADNKALIIASDPQYDVYKISENAGTPISILKGKTAVWQLAGVNSATLDVQGLYIDANCGGKGTFLVNSYNNLIPAIVKELKVLSASDIVLSFETVKDQLYEISIKTGTGAYIKLDTLENVSGLQTFTAKNLNTENNVYCLKIRTFDYCGLKEANSAEYCSIKLAGLVQNQANDLTWNSDLSFQLNSYQLKINNQNSTDFASRSSVISYTDVNVICGTQYCYQITGNYADGVASISNSKCLNAISNAIPPSVSEVLSTVNGNIVSLNWPIASATNYTVSFSVNKSAFSILGTTSATSFNDVQNNPSISSLCYKVAYLNNCGNASPQSSETCPVFLTGRINDAASRRVTWEPYVGWAEGVKEYLVEKLDGAGKPYFSVNVGTVLEYVDKGLDTLEQIINYRVQAISNSGRISNSNLWKAEQKGAFYLPNAFTPNGDGLNDEFHADGLFIKEFKLEIWNRFGEGVFAGTSFRQGWDGKINGQIAPVDTYMYKVEATDKLGVSYKRTGTLQLLK